MEAGRGSGSEDKAMIVNSIFPNVYPLQGRAAYGESHTGIARDLCDFLHKIVGRSEGTRHIHFHFACLHA